MVKVSGLVLVNASKGMRSALLVGLEICPTRRFTNEIETGQLERVLQVYEPASFPIKAVYPNQRLVPPRVRAVVDHLLVEFRTDQRLAL